MKLLAKHLLIILRKPYERKMLFSVCSLEEKTKKALSETVAKLEICECGSKLN